VDFLLDFAKGPLFAMTFLFMVLGLARRFFLQSVQLVEAIHKLNYRDFSLWQNVKASLLWLVPIGHIYRNRSIMRAVSFLFHIGLLVVPIFLVHHIDLWRRYVGISWPGISLATADVVTILTIACALILLFYRLADDGVRAMSTTMDYLLLVFIMIPFVSGFMACHPAVNPLSYKAMMLTHILSSEFLFVLIPHTKLVHCVVFFFDRVSSEVFWRMPVGAGERVARELRGEDARI
jgi:nitrate reductase gamma subunit